MRLQSPIKTYKTARAQCYTAKGLLYNAGFSYKSTCEFEVEDSVEALELTSFGRSNKEEIKHFWSKDTGWCGINDPRAVEALKKIMEPKPNPDTIQTRKPAKMSGKPKKKANPDTIRTQPSKTYVKVEKAFEKVTDADKSA